MITKKKSLRPYRCRICGCLFFSKGDMQRCVREHGKKNKDNFLRFKRLYK